MSLIKPPVCQVCGAPLTRSLVDLGTSPLANAFVAHDRADRSDPRYPLHARVCDTCLLVQVDSVVPPNEIFKDYVYFSSFSESWLAHCREYVKAMTARFALNDASQVVEIASNDGYLLQYFVAAGIPSLGIEPAANVAEAARTKGIPTEIAFFGAETAKRLLAEGYAADLLAAKNVLAHVPDIKDFVAGIDILLKPEGVFTVEFPHLLNLIRGAQFDTIYHEHFTYLSLLAIDKIFGRHNLRIFDVQEVPTHGGSLRVFACHANASHANCPEVGMVRAKENAAQLDRPEGYAGFQARAETIRDDLLAFLHDAKKTGKIVAGYGAAAKGNTLLNYAGVDKSMIAFVADLNPAKQGKLLPGSRIPVVSPAAIGERKPDFILILPWNLRAEITSQLSRVRQWGGRFVTAIPKLAVD
jgi:hypothetical protein